MSTGWDSIKKYFDTFLKNGDWNDPSRPETSKGNGEERRYVSLDKINPDVVDPRQEKMVNEVAWVAFVINKKLMKLTPRRS